MNQQSKALEFRNGMPTHIQILMQINCIYFVVQKEVKKMMRLGGGGKVKYMIQVLPNREFQRKQKKDEKTKPKDKRKFTLLCIQ